MSSHPPACSGPIVAAGLTPAWQQIAVLDRLSIGEVNRARETAACASGKVANVAIALHHLGLPVHPIILAGGETGRLLREDFQRLGIGADWVESANPTRICTTVIDRATREITELVENAYPVTPEEIGAYLNAYETAAKTASAAVLSGSLPPGSPPSFYRDLLERTPCPAILDARGPELLEALDARPYLVKPNREELTATLGQPLDSDDDLHEAMEELLELGAQRVVVTEGARAVWFASGQTRLKLEPPQLKVENPIGCGDCFAAGLAWALLRGFGDQAALRLAVAAAAENALTLHPARLNPGLVEKRMLEIAEPIPVARLAVSADELKRSAAD